MTEWLTAFCLHPVTILMFGGGIGTNARYWLGRFVIEQLQPEEIRFPWATFFINVSGSLILGFIAATFRPDPRHIKWYLLLGTGFCGGFTTFSTFSLEAFQMIQEGKKWLAALYVFGSVWAGLIGVWLAVKLAGN